MNKNATETPDYQYWLAMSHWTLEEASLLICGLDPERDLPQDKILRLEKTSVAYKVYELLKRAQKDHILYDYDEKYTRQACNIMRGNEFTIITYLRFWNDKLKSIVEIPETLKGFLEEKGIYINRPCTAETILQQASNFVNAIYEEEASKIKSLTAAPKQKSILQPEKKQVSLSDKTASENIKNKIIGKSEKGNCSQYVFRKTGDGWFIKFGALEINIKDKIGLNYISKLLHFPDLSYEVKTLIAPLRKFPPDMIASIQDNNAIAQHLGNDSEDQGKGYLIDGQLPLKNTDTIAIKQYKLVISDYDEEIKDAELMGDTIEAEKIKAQKKALLEQIHKDTGKGGKIRGSGGASENNRKSVGRAIATAIKGIEKYCLTHKLSAALSEQLIQHLKESIITGGMCCYRPKNKITWQ